MEDWKDVCLQCCGKLCAKKPTRRKKGKTLAEFLMFRFPFTTFYKRIFHAAAAGFCSTGVVATCFFVGVVGYRCMLLFMESVVKVQNIFFFVDLLIK